MVSDQFPRRNYSSIRQGGKRYAQIQRPQGQCSAGRNERPSFWLRHFRLFHKEAVGCSSREEKMSSGIFRFFGASVATMLFVGFALAPTPAPAQGLQCASNPLIGTWRLNLQKSTITRN